MKPDEADQAANPKAARQRRFWSAEEKRRMVAESFTPGVSVSKVAQRYGVNANLLFAWRRRLGDCDAVVSPEPIKLLPVTVVAAGKPGAAAAASEPVGRMEIVLNNGERIIVGADVDASSLARLIKALLRR
jgi:transposase